MNTSDAKRVLETALICSPQPLTLREMRVLFNDELGAETVKSLRADDRVKAAVYQIQSENAAKRAAAAKPETAASLAAVEDARSAL